MKGMKLDSGKVRVSLLPPEALLEIAEVFEFGAKKYEPYNWMKVPQGGDRYFDAFLRHLFAAWRGEEYDQESGLRHWAHAAACLLMLMVLVPRREKSDVPENAQVRNLREPDRG